MSRAAPQLAPAMGARRTGRRPAPGAAAGDAWCWRWRACRSAAASTCRPRGAFPVVSTSALACSPPCSAAGTGTIAAPSKSLLLCAKSPSSLRAQQVPSPLRVLLWCLPLPHAALPAGSAVLLRLLPGPPPPSPRAVRRAACGAPVVRLGRVKVVCGGDGVYPQPPHRRLPHRRLAKPTKPPIDASQREAMYEAAPDNGRRGRAWHGQRTTCKTTLEEESMRGCAHGIPCTPR